MKDNMIFLGKKLIHFKEIDSTQLEIFRQIKTNKIENGTVILTDIQTNGMRYTWKKLGNR